MKFGELLFGVLLAFLLLHSGPAHAHDVGEVISTSPSWETFTNTDGTGLYHEVLDAAFGQDGVKVRHIYSKSIRSEEMVLKGEADMMTCDDKATPPLMLGRYPMYANDFFVFFRKDRIDWKGVDSLYEKEVLAQPTYYNQENFSVPVKIKEVQTGAQALAMILDNRSDFYVDDMALIQQSMKENGVTFDREKYDIRRVGSRSYHPLFNDTDRGKLVMEMYNSAIFRLHKSGRLKPIFDKWGYSYPDYDSY